MTDSKEELEERIDRLEEQLKEIKVEETDSSSAEIDSTSGTSRRDFLKKIGAGVAGLGALSLAPATSQLKLTKNGIETSGSIVTGSLDTSSQSTVSVGLTSTQSLNAGNELIIPFDNVFMDKRGEWDTSNSKFVADQSGQYMVQLSAYLTDNGSTGDRIDLKVKKNGSGFLGTVSYRDTGSQYQSFKTPAKIVDLNSGDEITFHVKNHDSSDTLNYGSYTFGTVRKIG